MTRLPRITAERLIKALRKVGYEPVRRKGSHVILKDDTGRVTVVPVHKGEVLGPGIIRKVLRDCDLAVEQFVDLIG
jgi:predicted RNA binding protein YcfA (HicA-like mRNA interferase family)